MLKTALLLVSVMAAGLCKAQDKAAPCKSTAVGHLEIIPLKSAVFGNMRMLRVWLPEGYDDPANATRHYPVLYLLDAQSVFDRCTAVTQVSAWQAGDTLTDLIARKKIEPIIAVGIDNAGAKRAFEYLPYPDFTYRADAPEPGGKLFPKFLADEVIPFVKSHFRVSSDAAHTGIGGSSYGAVAALNALITRPDLFELGLLESTSLQVGNAQLLRDTSPLPKGPVRVYVGVGTDEDEGETLANAGMVRLTEMLAGNLKSAVLNRPDVMLRIEPGGKHNAQAWGRRFPAAVEFLFGPR